MITNLTDLEQLLKIKTSKYFSSKPEMATRQCSAAVINEVS